MKDTLILFIVVSTVPANSDLILRSEHSERLEGWLRDLTMPPWFETALRASSP
jgi:hypothetical protein